LCSFNTIDIEILRICLRGAVFIRVKGGEVPGGASLAPKIGPLGMVRLRFPFLLSSYSIRGPHKTCSEDPLLLRGWILAAYQIALQIDILQVDIVYGQVYGRI